LAHSGRQCLELPGDRPLPRLPPAPAPSTLGAATRLALERAKGQGRTRDMYGLPGLDARLRHHEPTAVPGGPSFGHRFEADPNGRTRPESTPDSTGAEPACRFVTQSIAAQSSILDLNRTHTAQNTGTPAGKRARYPTSPPTDSASAGLHPGPPAGPRPPRSQPTIRPVHSTGQPKSIPSAGRAGQTARERRHP